MFEREVPERPARFYQNPVSSHPFADPFVMKHSGQYWGYSTGFWRDGRCFGILHSRDLVQWQEIGAAMAPLPGGHTCYWAPEVSYDSGQFLLYYSVGNEERMEIRVAISDTPAGPFVDSGTVLTTEEFAIDPHVFIDDDGQKYLFYATDFLTHTHIGTGTVVDRMLDNFTLSGNPRPVTRARYDWQVYDPQRAEKGGVRWHTVEGPAVIKHKQRYYQMFSGGNWKNVSYGVSYAVTDSLQADHEWHQASDGMDKLPILRTLPGKVTGPGHNSIVRGPDNQHWFCVYHRWAENNQARVMCIDRLEWVGRNLTVLGPSVTTQPAPNQPTLVDFFPEDRPTGLGENWQCHSGRWSTRGNQACQDSMEGSAEARARLNANGFVVEVTAQLLSAGADGGYGLLVRGLKGTSTELLLLPVQNCVSISILDAGERRNHKLKLPARFSMQTSHLFRLEINGRQIQLQINPGVFHWQNRLPEPAETISLLTRHCTASFAGFALTAGWQDLFTQPGNDPAETGWRAESGDWAITDGALWQKDSQAFKAHIVKTVQLVSHELVVNARLDVEGSPDSGYGVSLLGSHPAGELTVMIRRGLNGWLLTAEHIGSRQSFSMPGDFEPAEFHQFRFRKEGTKLRFWLLTQFIGEIECAAETVQIGLISQFAEVAFDLVRVTALNPA